MKFFTKHKIYWLLGGGIILLYLITRLYNLGSLPVFTDEAIYIRWAQIAHDDTMWRFISLTDGKQPSFIWIAMVMLSVIQDPLLAGRLVSVIAGFFTMIGMFLLGRELFKNTTIGLLSGLLYVLYPFALVYDRLALYDSLVAMFVVWAMYFSVLLVRYLRLDLALLLGMIIGGGLLTKTNTAFSLILLPASLLLFPFNGKFDKKKIGKWIALAAVAFVISMLMYAVLILSPYFYIIEEKNLTFVYSFNEWIAAPFAYAFGNLKGLSEWLIAYLSIPFGVLAIASFFVKKESLREKIYLLLWFIVPFMALAFFGKVIYPRYLLFMTLPLILLGAYTMSILFSVHKAKLYKMSIVLVFTSMFIITDVLFITNPVKASLPATDREQFVVGWPAGGGVKETVTFLEEKAKSERIYVGTQGTFGLMPHGLEMYLIKNPNITIKGYWPITDVPPQELLDAAKKMPTYVIFYQPCPSCDSIGKAPKTWPVTEEFQIKKAEGTYYTVYKLKSE